MQRKVDYRHILMAAGIQFDRPDGSDESLWRDDGRHRYRSGNRGEHTKNAQRVSDIVLGDLHKLIKHRESISALFKQSYF